jgi:hypothetical protein
MLRNAKKRRAYETRELETQNFLSCLSHGQHYEKKALDYILYDDIKYPDINVRKYYDFEISINGEKIKYEVKADRKASITGNIAVEFECNKRPSGIFTTWAKFYIYFINYMEYDECYIIPVNDLKNICNIDNRKVRGGDGMRAMMYLVNIEDIKSYKTEKIKENTNIISDDDLFDDFVEDNKNKSLNDLNNDIQELKKINNDIENLILKTQKETEQIENRNNGIYDDGSEYETSSETNKKIFKEMIDTMFNF